MTTGTKSLLFGVHQFLWHPLTVCRAWRSLYQHWPTWREFVCIVVHDWGYWGCPYMDDERGQNHPYVGARIAGRLFGYDYYYLVAWHSRHLARRWSMTPSLLTWPDKFSILYDPEFWYLARARWSGELEEYRQEAADAGVVSIDASDHEWFQTLRNLFRAIAQERHERT